LRGSADAFLASGDPLGEAFARTALALALAEGPVGELTEAEREITTALEIFRARGHAWGLTVALIGAGRVHLSAGDISAARAVFTEALEVSTANSDEFSRGISEHQLGVAEFHSGNADSAAALFRASLRRAARLSHAEGIAHGLEALCALAAMLGDEERAATLLGAARTARGKSGVYSTPPVSFFEAARQRFEEAHVGDDAFAARRDMGAALDTGTAAAYALDAEGTDVGERATRG
jgi:tetratricopeptide (TPR) repeat protein